MPRFQGEFMDGRSAAVRRVAVSFDGLFLIVGDADLELARWEVAEISANGIQERDVVHLQVRGNPDALLTLRGVEAIEQLGALGITTKGLPRRATSRLILAAGCAVLIAVIAGLVWISVKPISKAVAHRIPLDVERGMVGGVERRLAPSYCESDTASLALVELSARLLGEGHDLPPVHVLNLEVPNAFALPGGTVVLTRGLTESAEGPDEIAGVLAHELEHVRQRHVMAGVVRAVLLSAVWAISVGDYAGMMVIDPTTAFQIATLKFSREDEAQADRGAFEMLARAQIDSDGLSSLFERLEEENGEIPEWLSSHPVSGRRAVVATSAVESTLVFVPALSSEGWLAVQQACQDAPAPEAELKDLWF